MSFKVMQYLCMRKLRAKKVLSAYFAILVMQICCVDQQKSASFESYF